MITAKVVCASKTEHGEGDDRHADVTFGADYADERNKEWAKWTPALTLTMKLNGQAADLFEQGKAYTLQFVEEAMAQSVAAHADATESATADYIGEGPDAATHHPEQAATSDIPGTAAVNWAAPTE